MPEVRSDQSFDTKARSLEGKREASTRRRPSREGKPWIRFRLASALIAFVLIAGLVARRIVCTVHEGQLLAAGERIGLIRFGSRVDVYIPPPYVPLVALGQRMIAGETVLADRLAQEPPRSGFAH